jgi:hypothetical protein
VAIEVANAADRVIIRLLLSKARVRAQTGSKRRYVCGRHVDGSTAIERGPTNLGRVGGGPPCTRPGSRCPVRRRTRVRLDSYAQTVEEVSWLPGVARSKQVSHDRGR